MPSVAPYSQIRMQVRIKRIIDIGFVLLTLPMTLPVGLVIAGLVFFIHGNPIVFRQERLGFMEERFYIYKFRSMRDLKGEDGNLLPDNQRITKFGSLLRSTSLDEIPQLWNVLLGHMSLVGPRPLYPHYLTFYTQRERMRHLVRPGITGLAQVSGRNSLLWDDRLELDAHYVEQLSIWNDLRILWKTAQKVISREDIIIIPGTQQGPLDQVRGGGDNA